MHSKSNQECCNGDCNQGRTCPAREDGTVKEFDKIAIAFIVIMIILMSLKSYFS